MRTATTTPTVYGALTRCCHCTEPCGNDLVSSTQQSQQGAGVYLHDRLLFQGCSTTSRILKGLHLHFYKLICSHDHGASSYTYGTAPHVSNGSWRVTWLISLTAHSHSRRWVPFIQFTEGKMEAPSWKGLGKGHPRRNGRAIHRTPVMSSVTDSLLTREPSSLRLSQLSLASCLALSGREPVTP